MRRFLLAMLVVLTSCASVNLQTDGAETVVEDRPETPAVAEDSSPVLEERPPSSDPLELRCPTDEMESAIFDFVVGEVEPTLGENSAVAAATRFMSAENPGWQLRRDWQRLSLDQERSTGNTIVYLGRDGFPYMHLSVRQASGTWVVDGYSSCAPLPEDVVAFDEDFVPIPNSAGDLPFHQRLECAGNLVSMEFLWWLPPAEGRDFQQMRDAIDPFLETAEGGSGANNADWFVAHADEDNRVAPKATLVSRDGDNFSWMNLAMTDGQWRWNGSSSGGDCELHIVLEDRNTVEWEVIKSSPDSSVVRVLANERECASGQAMGDRLREPYVTLTPDFAYILLAADRLPGDFQSCPSNPSVEIDIDLGEALGAREIRNTQTTMGWFSDHWPDQ